MPIARGELGQKEVAGPGDNSRIAEYLASTTIGEPYNRNDETPWCSAFVNWCIERAGLRGTRSALARSWLEWGREIREPVPGCIAVFTREGGGHVAFYLGRSGDNIYVLGGNQSNAVTEAAYAASRLLGYRLPA